MRDRRGMSALFDATAFLVIMLVASSSLYAYSGLLAREARASVTADEMAYARTMLSALLRTSAANASYSLGGETVAVGGASVEALLAQELAVLIADAGADFSALNSEISRIADGLADGRLWSLECSYENATLGGASIMIGSEPGATHASASAEPQMAGGYAGRASIRLHVWRP